MKNKKIPGMGSPDNFYKSEQLRKLMLQFMAIFTDMAVESGTYKDRGAGLIPVPIYYGDPDRVVAALKSGNTNNRPISVPCMTARMQSIDVVSNLQSGLNIQTREVRTPLGGIAPNDTVVNYQLNPFAYMLRFELNILTSNTDHQTQLLEQIMLMFGVPIQFQTNDAPVRNSITTCTLTGIQFDRVYPLGMEPSYRTVTMQFDCPAYISAPISVRDNIIKKIKMRIGAISQDAVVAGDMMEELDLLGIDYITLADITDEEI